jgi:hypothetical protein
VFLKWGDLWVVFVDAVGYSNEGHREAQYRRPHGDDAITYTSAYKRNDAHNYGGEKHNHKATYYHHAYGQSCGHDQSGKFCFHFAFSF